MTEKQYNRHFDPKINHRAYSVKAFYLGYKHVVCIEDYNHIAYVYGPGFSIGEDLMYKWLNENCKGEFRSDVFRVSWHNNDWIMNELGGGDYVFFAFTDQRDAAWFSLKWL